MTGIIRLTDQTAYQQITMVWQLLQALSITNSLNQFDFQSSSCIIDYNTGLCTFNLVRPGIIKYLVRVYLISFRGHLESPF